MFNRFKTSDFSLILLFLIFILLLISLTFFTHYYGSTDLGDYADTAKFFAGKYHANIRNSHSYLFGFFHFPFLKSFNNFLIFKFTSLFFLSLIIYSVYFLSGKNKKALWLILLSPIVWYIAPWISPIQLSGLLLLWAYYYMAKYRSTKNIYCLVSSGVLIGLGWAFWNTLLFIGTFLGIIYLFDKKLYHSLFFIFSIFLGLFPLLVLDYFMFNFPFYTLLKTTASNFVATYFGGIYGFFPSDLVSKLIILFLIFLFIPFYYWKFYSPSIFKKEYRSLLFISLVLLLILTNPQLRYLIVILPIILLFIINKLNNFQFKKQLIFSFFIILILIVPYLFQIRYQVDDQIQGVDISYFLKNINTLHFSSPFRSSLILNDLVQITKNYPNQTFLVGPAVDDYQVLADLYWNNNIHEFVSIQDYDLYLQNKTILFQKNFSFQPKINERRQIFFIGGMRINEASLSDYSKIQYVISVNEPFYLKDFKFVQKYNVLYLYKKEI